MNYEEFMKYVDKMNNNIRKNLKDNEEELTFYSQLVISFNETCNKNQKQKEVIDNIQNFIKEFHKNRNMFKWNEQDYIDVILKLEKMINEKEVSK